MTIEDRNGDIDIDVFKLDFEPKTTTIMITQQKDSFMCVMIDKSNKDKLIDILNSIE